MALVSLEGRGLDVNDALCRILGRSGAGARSAGRAAQPLPPEKTLSRPRWAGDLDSVVGVAGAQRAWPAGAFRVADPGHHRPAQQRAALVRERAAQPPYA
ncbi:hypothetical protein G6F63_016303 [Rhizopus arrhizus]|nr:hypothetical protein G6F63_016303 [Rhizopus arrhizus]